MAATLTKPPGRWKKGESGNPAGRKPGNDKLAQLRAGIAARVPALLEQLMTQALEGDTQAARLLLERVLPPLKPKEETTPLALPDGTLLARGEAVLSAVADGELAPGQGAVLMGAIGALARITEVDSLTKRIEALEAQHGTNT